MVSRNRSSTIVKIATLEEELESCCTKFSQEFERIVIGRREVEKRVLWRKNEEKPYFLVISQLALSDRPRVNYNSVLTVTSLFPEENVRIVSEFQEKTGLLLETAPQQLKKLMKKISLLYDGLFIEGSNPAKVLSEVGLYDEFVRDYSFMGGI